MVTSSRGIKDVKEHSYKQEKDRQTGHYFERF